MDILGMTTAKHNSFAHPTSKDRHVHDETTYRPQPPCNTFSSQQVRSLTTPPFQYTKEKVELELGNASEFNFFTDGHY